MDTPDTEWKDSHKGKLWSTAVEKCFQAPFVQVAIQHLLMRIDEKHQEELASHDTYWKEVLQGIYNKGLPTIEQIKQSALGWGKEGSERYEGYIQGAKDVNVLVIWELCSHGIPLNLDGKPPTPQQKALARYQELFGGQKLVYANEITLPAFVEEIVETTINDTVERVENELRKYNELLLAVGNKYEGETRHQTALRYIQNAEIANDSVAKLSNNKEETI